MDQSNCQFGMFLVNHQLRNLDLDAMNLPSSLEGLKAHPSALFLTYTTGAALDAVLDWMASERGAPIQIEERRHQIGKSPQLVLITSLGQIRRCCRRLKKHSKAFNSESLPEGLKDESIRIANSYGITKCDAVDDISRLMQFASVVSSEASAKDDFTVFALEELAL